MKTWPKRAINCLGFTLVETLVVITVVAIISIGVTAMYLGQVKITRNEIRTVGTQVNTAAILNSVLSTTNQAQAILDSATVNSVDYTSDSDTVIITLPALDEDNTPVSGEQDVIVFNKENDGSLTMTTEAASGSKRDTGVKTLLDEVESLNITYQNTTDIIQSDWFQMDITRQVNTSEGNKNIELSYKISLKNK